MLHKNRRWQIVDVTSDELLEKLLNHSWTGCTGWRCNGIFWLNDATSGDGAAEYAIVRESDSAQIESLTVSWCSADDLKDYIARYSAQGAVMEPCFAWKLDPRHLEHGKSCHLCA